jgi:hypothetical protein
MRLLQWFYQSQSEATERITTQSYSIQFVESSAVVNITPSSSDSFSLETITETDTPFEEFLPIGSSDSFGIITGSNTFILPIDPPLGTGEIIVGLGEEVKILKTQVEILVDTFSIKTFETSDLFKGLIFSPPTAEELVTGNLIETFVPPMVVSVGATDSFSVEAEDGFVSDISFDGSDTISGSFIEIQTADILIDSLESFSIEFIPNGVFIPAIRRPDILSLGFVETIKPLILIPRTDSFSIEMIDVGVLFLTQDAAEIFSIILEIDKSVTNTLDGSDSLVVIVLESELGPRTILVDSRGSDGVKIISLEGSELEITVIPDDETLSNFPGLQATWEDEPYMSLA